MSSLIDNTPPEQIPAGPTGAKPSDLAEKAPETTEPTQVEVFDREYVQSLREEAARYRTERNQYAQAFEGMGNDERDAWLAYVSLSRQAASGDQNAIGQLQEAGLWEAPSEEENRQEAALTAAEVERMLDQRLSQRDMQSAEAQAIAEVQSEARNLGYDPQSERYVLLLHYANQLPEGTPNLLGEADKMVKAYDQSIIDGLMASKTSDARNSLVLPTQSGIPNQPRPPAANWAEARERLDERLRA